MSPIPENPNVQNLFNNKINQKHQIEFEISFFELDGSISSEKISP
jgi:hypothetical protein